MRRALLAGSFVALIAALVFLWMHRYERVPGLPVWRLAGLRQGVPEVPGVAWEGSPDRPVLRLFVEPGHAPVALRMALPGARAVDLLHLRYHMAGDGLEPGARKWETGRFMIEWFPPDGGGEPERDFMAGAVLDKDGGMVSLVAVPELGPALPALRFEHLGKAGSFRLETLEVTAVRERRIWHYGRWLLASGVFLWILACIRSLPEVTPWRSIGAAAVCLLMVLQFAIPGPWKSQRPLFGVDFRIDRSVSAGPQEQAPPPVAASPQTAIQSGPVRALESLPARGSLTLRVRLVLNQARPLLHVLLFLAPTLALALLLDRRAALFLAIPLALAVEAAQVAFGYGFDWIDILDLVVDGMGIALGLRGATLGLFRRLRAQ